MSQPRIGQEAVLRGKRVIYAGQNYGYQSPGSYKQLENAGKLKIGTQAIDRFISSLNPLTQKLSQAQQAFRQATDNIPGVKEAERLTIGGLKASDRLPSSRVAQGSATLAQKVAQYLNIDPRLAMVGMVAAGASGRFPKGTATSLGQPRRTAKAQPLGQNIDASGVPYRTARNGIQYQDPFHGAQRPPSNRPPLSPEKQAQIKKLIQQGRAKEAQAISDAQYNTTASRPASTKPPQNPAPSPGNPRPHRIFVEGTGGVKRLETGYDIKPSDLAKPRGDGNDYGQAATINEVPGYTNSGQFIVSNNTAHNAARNAQRQGYLDQQAAAKGNAKATNHAAILDEVAWADDDVVKLNKILTGLGGKPQRYASDAKRAINKRLSADANIHAGKPSLTEAERKALTQGWNWKNLQGVTQPEVNLLNQLANGQFNHLFKPIKQVLESQYFRGAQVPPEIQRRLDALSDPPIAKPVPLTTNRRQTFDERINATLNALPKPANTNKLKTPAKRTTPPAPRITDEVREARRAAKPELRPAAQRVPTPTKTQFEKLLIKIRNDNLIVPRNY